MANRQDLARFATTRIPTRTPGVVAIERLRDIARLDVGRETRKGLPEVILAEGKEPRDVAEIVVAMVGSIGRAIVSRASERYLRSIRANQPPNSRVQFFEKPSMIVVKRRSYSSKRSGGRVGLLTAGTSDIPVAGEALVILHEMGCQTQEFYDVGAAGIHRLFKPLARLLSWNPDVILVVAGREGALPTVVAGMVDAPIIAVPTSRSYGFGDKGVAALAAMLQSCSLGLAVVNIDGGVGAGSVAALIANRAAAARARIVRE